MPARDGTGPLGQGARMGRGMGNCTLTTGYKDRGSSTTSITSIANRSFRWGGRVWDVAFSRLFGRRRANRIHRR